MNTTACCFTGHRNLPAAKKPQILKRLEEEIDKLIKAGITDFISGGALGFDQLAALLVIERKKTGKPVRLILALPCPQQDALWTEKQKLLYQSILHKADEIYYISNEYTDNFMKKRNYFMVDHANYCIFALLHKRSGTGQTVHYAYKKTLQ